MRFNPDIRHRIDADAILGERPGPGDDPRDAEIRWLRHLLGDAASIIRRTAELTDATWIYIAPSCPWSGLSPRCRAWLGHAESAIGGDQ